MFLHLGRTLSEACKVFALGRIWLGAVKFLTFRKAEAFMLDGARRDRHPNRGKQAGKQNEAKIKEGRQTYRQAEGSGQLKQVGR
jgi:hypothetical protein